MWIVVVSISFFAVVVAVFPILFEDALKKSNKSVPTIVKFKTALSAVNPFKRWFILSILLLNTLNCVISINSLNNNKRTQKAIELEKENIFIHFQNEVDDNLQKLLFIYDSINIMKFADTSLFTSVKLSDLFITKYSSISQQEVAIRWLTQASEAINSVNNSIDHINNNPWNPVEKKIEIKFFLRRVETAKKYLYPIFERVYKLHSYKEYEAIDFDADAPPINIDTLNLFIFRSALRRPDVEYTPSQN